MFAELEKIINDGKNRFNAFDQASSALEQAKSLVQFIKEKNLEKDKIQNELLSLKKSVDEWKVKEKSAKDAALEVEEEASNKAKSIIADANAQAGQILGKAVLESDKIKQDTVKTESELLKTKDLLFLSKQELDTVNNELEAVKAKFRAIAGA